MCAEPNGIPGKRKKQKPILELLVILALGLGVYTIASDFDIMERLVEFSRQHENGEIDEVFAVSLYFLIGLSFFAVRRWRDARNARDLLLTRNRELQKALSEIKQLKGIIPICAACKRVRDDGGFWHQVESYLRDHSEAEFSHSLCPEYMRKLYPEMVEDERKNEDVV